MISLFWERKFGITHDLLNEVIQAQKYNVSDSLFFRMPYYELNFKKSLSIILCRGISLSKHDKNLNIHIHVFDARR